MHVVDLWARTSGFRAEQPHTWVANVRVKHTNGVRTTADAGDGEGDGDSTKKQSLAEVLAAEVQTEQNTHEEELMSNSYWLGEILAAYLSPRYLIGLSSGTFPAIKRDHLAVDSGPEVENQRVERRYGRPFGCALWVFRWNTTCGR